MSQAESEGPRRHGPQQPRHSPGTSGENCAPGLPHRPPRAGSQQHGGGSGRTVSCLSNQAALFLRQKPVLPFPSPTFFSLISCSFSPHPIWSSRCLHWSPQCHPLPTPFSPRPSSVSTLGSIAAARLSSPRSDAEGIKTCFHLTLSDVYSLLLQSIFLSLPIPVLPSLSPQSLGRTMNQRWTLGSRTECRQPRPRGKLLPSEVRGVAPSPAKDL